MRKRRPPPLRHQVDPDLLNKVGFFGISMLMTGVIIGAVGIAGKTLWMALLGGFIILFGCLVPPALVLLAKRRERKAAVLHSRKSM